MSGGWLAGVRDRVKFTELTIPEQHRRASEIDRAALLAHIETLEARIADAWDEGLDEGAHIHIYNHNPVNPYRKEAP